MQKNEDGWAKKVKFSGRRCIPLASDCGDRYHCRHLPMSHSTDWPADEPTDGRMVSTLCVIVWHLTGVTYRHDTV